VLIGMGTWGIFYLKGQNSSLEDRRDNINAAIVEQQLSTAELKALNDQVTAAEAPAATLKSLLDNLDASRDAMKADLDVVHEYAADSGVSLGNVSVDKTGISIAGTADTEDQVLKYYGKLLYESGRFSTVMIGSISVSEDGVGFRMDLSG